MTTLKPLAKAITQAYRMDEALCLEKLIQETAFSEKSLHHIENQSRDLVLKVRQRRLESGGLDAFLHTYDLSTEEGIALMCLAESLLRIPDSETRDRLIKDKIVDKDWQQHLGNSHSAFVNAATYGLLFTGKILDYQRDSSHWLSVLKRVFVRISEPIIRQSVLFMMQVLGGQFVMAETIEKALQRAVKKEESGYCYSYDMLGEAAKTAADARIYLKSYQHAIAAIAKVSQDKGVIAGPGISVKLSAIFPRFEWVQKERVYAELFPILIDLVLQAKKANIGFTIDAEEADRLELSLQLFEMLIAVPELESWEGLGLAVQAYQKRAIFVIDWLIALARKHQRRIMVRLVKGAYWDSEIKWAQEKGLNGYPVFTRKAATDVSYLACAKKLFTAMDVIYPQFATHNAYTVSAVLELAREARDHHEVAPAFEFQCLHGMGDSLYDNIVLDPAIQISCRIYAPVGNYRDLLPYLVRRLLENGANSSFVNRIVDEQTQLEDLIGDPIAYIQELNEKPHPRIPLPKDLYGSSRINSSGIDLSNPLEIKPLLKEVRAFARQIFGEDADQPTEAPPLITPDEVEGDVQEYVKQQKWGPEQIKAWFQRKPSQEADVIVKGEEENHTDNDEKKNKDKAPSHDMEEGGDKNRDLIIQIKEKITKAHEATDLWNRTPVEERVACLVRMADLLEEDKAELMALLIREGGKSIQDSISEIREAVDYCRYYGVRARTDFKVKKLIGPTGEENQLALHGRGVIACISPWNFPLAIFLGQVTSALAAGNTVLAKPATQTPLIAQKAIQLLHEAGIPESVVQLVLGGGKLIGEHLIPDERVQGIMFTGSTDTARNINQKLAARLGPIVPFIAETGGQNAMIVDSSALPEQVVNDVIASSFNSAGQRCSALRVLFLQEEVSDKILTMLKGAMAQLSIGDPLLLSTDIGPVIDSKAKQDLDKHVKKMNASGKLIAECKLPRSLPVLPHGAFFAPRVYQIDNIGVLTGEVFGPILHVIVYKSKDLDKVIDSINNTGYGLTLGIHSRVDETIDYIHQRLRVGNTYVNRNMIGAVVGVQPFGGEGLSGTGPKAGGPHILPRLAIERTLSVNTTASGGNVGLMSLVE